VVWTDDNIDIRAEQQLRAPEDRGEHPCVAAPGAPKIRENTNDGPRAARLLTLLHGIGRTGPDQKCDGPQEDNQDDGDSRSRPGKRRCRQLPREVDGPR